MPLSREVHRNYNFVSKQKQRVSQTPNVQLLAKSENGGNSWS